MEFVPPAVSDGPIGETLAGALPSLVRQGLERQGRVRLRLRGDSMWPSVPGGSLVDVRRASVGEVRLGDIVVWQRGDELIAHRVVQKVGSSREPMLRTRGDNCASCDHLLSGQQLVGRVTAIRQGHTTLEQMPWQRSLEAAFWVSRWRVRSFLNHAGRALPLSVRRPLVRIRERGERALSRGVARLYPW